MLFIFKTTAAMKPYNYKKYWISSKIIGEKQIEADDLNDAIRIYAEAAADDCVTITKSALKNKRPMYIDTPAGSTKQNGYVITGSVEFDNAYAPSGKSCVKQYIDLWVEIITVVETNFGAA